MNEIAPSPEMREKYGMAAFPDTARRIIDDSLEDLERRKAELDHQASIPERLPHSKQELEEHELSMAFWNRRYEEEVAKHNELVEFLKPVTG